MAMNLAVPVPKGSKISRDRGIPDDFEFDEVRRTCARLLAQGFSRRQVSKAMSSRLTRSGNEKVAYNKLNRWMNREQKFRDLIFEEAVKSLDLKTPLILGGVAKAAMRGRVDAARLALEITGRHTSHEQVVTNVQVVLQNIPRPSGQIIDGEADEIE